MKPLVKNTISILSAGLLALGSAIYPNFVSAVEVSNSILEKNNKTASPLDNNLETKVTLSFPGSEDVLAQDIVFVLDKSGASDQKGIDSQARQFLDDIKQQAD